VNATRPAEGIVECSAKVDTFLATCYSDRFTKIRKLKLKAITNTVLTKASVLSQKVVFFK
jgi:hypothetical protein